MNHKVKTHSDSFNIIFDKLKTGKPFTYVRFGDGDYIMMYEESLNQVIGGGNRFFVTPKLQKELVECHNIQDDNFLIGTVVNNIEGNQMAKTNSKVHHEKLPASLIEHKELLAMSCMFEVFLKDINKFIEFSKELRKTSTMFVSSYTHENIAKIYGNGLLVRVPHKNCYSIIDNIYAAVLRDIDKVDKIVLSSGQSGRVIAKRLWKDGIRKTVLDTGSLSDAFIFNILPIMKSINVRTFMRQVEDTINTNTNILLNSLK